MIPKYPCKKDIKNEHYWKFLGIIERSDIVYKIYECTQCKEAIWEELNFVYKKDLLTENKMS